jgi:hypothetical protein
MTAEPTPLGHRVRPASEWLSLLLIPLTALVAILPLLIRGCSCGHDFDFHLLSWIEAATQFSHGNLHPHWAFTPAFNAGEPRFVFYPPLSWYLGAAIGLVLNHLPGVSESAAWSAAPIVFTWIALTLSGLALYRLARAFATPNPALLASILYIVNPYMLFTAYERTAYGELLAAAWIPLLLLAILRDQVTIPRIAIPLALLWLTNAPAAVMGSYTLALLAAIRLVSAFRSTTNQGAPCLDSQAWASRHRSSLSLAAKIVAGTALGLAIAAVYILPAAYERRYVQVGLAQSEGMRIQDNTLFHHTGATDDQQLHDQVLRTASVIAVILLIATAAALIAAAFLRKNTGPRTASGAMRIAAVSTRPAPFPVLPLAILAAGIGFLLTPWAVPVWNHAPQAAFLQFPWRLLAILAAVLALATAAALTSLNALLRLNSAAAIATGFILAAAFTLPAYHIFQQPCDLEDTPAARLALFHSPAGTDPTDEYTPTTADNEELKSSPPPFWLADSAQAPIPTTQSPGPAPRHFTVTAPRGEDLILNLRDYPAWQIQLDTETDPQRLKRPDGLIALPIPAGRSTIDIRYTRTTDQTLGDAITLLAVALLIVATRKVSPAS